MRLKVEPGDFCVREDMRFPEARGGEYFVHVLRKEKLDTQEPALATIEELFFTDLRRRGFMLDVRAAFPYLHIRKSVCT